MYIEVWPFCVFKMLHTSGQGTWKRPPPLISDIDLSLCVFPSSIRHSNFSNTDTMTSEHCFKGTQHFHILTKLLKKPLEASKQNFKQVLCFFQNLKYREARSALGPPGCRPVSSFSWCGRDRVIVSRWLSLPAVHHELTARRWSPWAPYSWCLPLQCPGLFCLHTKLKEHHHLAFPATLTQADGLLSRSTGALSFLIFRNSTFRIVLLAQCFCGP